MSLPSVFQRRSGAPSTSPLCFDQLLVEPAEHYHAQRDRYLSSHRLAEFRRCPLLFHKQECGLIADEERPAYLLGRAAHCLILEGRAAFDAEFAVGGPINPKTGKPYGTGTQAFARWADEIGKPVLSDEQAALVERMALAVQEQPHAMDLLAEGVPERIARCELSGVPCQVRADWLHPSKGLVDLKTAEKLDWFEGDARAYGYLHQLAFYRSVLAEVLGARLPVHLVAVEKREPFRCGVWRVEEAALDRAEEQNLAAIEMLKQCRHSGQWPGGFEDVRSIDYL